MQRRILERAGATRAVPVVLVVPVFVALFGLAGAGAPSTRPEEPGPGRVGPAAAGKAAARRPPPPEEPDLTRVAIRTWCDQTVPVAVEDMTFGVRYIGASTDPATIKVSPSRPWWRAHCRVYRDGKLVAHPPGPPVDPNAAAPRAVTLQVGDFREFTFSLADVLEADEITPGRYLLVVHLDPQPADPQGVEIEVWDEKEEGGKTRRMGRMTAQGVKPATQPTTQPASKAATRP